MRKPIDLQKRREKKIAPIVVTVLVILYVLPLMSMVLWAAETVRQESGVHAMLPLLCYALLGGAVIVGVIKALRQRLEEIDNGEEDDAGQY